MDQLVINAKRFAVETFDGETIVMDLVGGRLYLFEGSASTFLESLIACTSVAFVERAIAEKYGEHHRQIFSDFVRSLLDKEIFTESNDDSAGSARSPHFVWPEMLGELVVTEYDDMSSIITMDPIHDVDPEKGWPFKEDL